MKRLKKAGIVLSVFMLMTSFFTVNASAATVSDGIKAEVSVTAQSDDNASIEAVVKNANYYEIGGINCKLSISDNAEISGENIKTDITLSKEQTESLKAKISLKETAESKPAETSTEVSDNEPTTSTQTSAPSEDSVTVKPAETTDSSTIKTGQNDNAVLISALLIMAISIALIIALRKKNKHVISIMLCLCLTLSVVAVGNPVVRAATDEKISVITDETVITIGDTDVTVTFTVEYPEQPEIHDNSLDDLKALNGGEIDVTYNEAGEISFLSGKYTDYKVINEETAMSSLQAVETLLNAKENDVTLLLINEKSSDNGDRYYTFQQIVGAVSLTNALITVGVDKDGNTLCLSSSINPYADDKAQKEDIITAEQAENIVDSMYGDGYTSVDQEPVLDYLFVDMYGESSLCWVVFRQQPVTAEQDSEKSRYCKFYVNAVTGNIVNQVTASALEDYRTEENTFNNDVYFEVSTEMMTFTDYFGKKVELPVAKSDNGKYYFCDKQRRMICTDTGSVDSQMVDTIIEKVVPFEFASPDEVSPIFVSVFDNMRKVYDNYAQNGLKSLNGDGLPIQIGFGYSQYGEKLSNACYCGNLFGWGCFMFGEFPISVGLDVAAHEYTHGVKRNITGMAAYENNAGAIEESYADILGNLTEMIVDPENSDTETWLMGENTDSPIRSMSNPHIYAQPEYIADAYYVMNSPSPDNLNDRGGVHINNSILSYICYQMSKNGIGMQDNYNIWLNTFLVFNPNADFDDVYSYIKFIAVRNGNEEYLPLIDELFKKANVTNAKTDCWDNVSVPNGYAKITLKPQNFPEDILWAGVLKYDDKRCMIAEDFSGNYIACVDKAAATLIIKYQESPNQAPKQMYAYKLNEQDKNVIIDSDNMVLDINFNELVPIE
ncbi:MAG: M4 family metallopeptidase [Acutalibacteraceae bacterium]